jgi:hypothetical protein
MHPFWQGDYYDILACRSDDKNCQTSRKGKTIAKWGCALTSMAMLYWNDGFWWIPDENHVPIFSIPTSLNPRTFNNLLSARDKQGSLLGFNDDNNNFDWYKTTTNFYYYNSIAYQIGLHYEYVIPNYECDPLKKPDSASCFRKDWSDPDAMKLLDHDISWGTGWRPAIVNIKYTNLTDKKLHSHFVVIAGYEKKSGRADDIGWYRAHNPMFRDNLDNVPKALKGETQYGMNDGESYRLNGIVRLYRFKHKYHDEPIDTRPWVYLRGRCPIQMQIIDPDGNLMAPRYFEWVMV